MPCRRPPPGGRGKVWGHRFAPPCSLSQSSREAQEDSLSQARNIPTTSMCVRIPPNTDGGPPAAVIPTPVRLQVRSENGRPLDPPPTADSCCCCSFVGSCRRRAPSGTKRKQPVRPPNKIKNIQIYGRARSSLFPQIYSRHSAPPQDKGSSPFSRRSIHSGRKETTHHQHVPVVHSHTPLNPPPSPPPPPYCC